MCIAVLTAAQGQTPSSRASRGVCLGEEDRRRAADCEEERRLPGRAHPRRRGDEVVVRRRRGRRWSCEDGEAKQGAPRDELPGMSVDEEVLITEIGTGGRAHDTRAREREWEKSYDMISVVCYCNVCF